MPSLVDLNYIALEVANVEEALHLYCAVFSLSLRGTHKGADGSLEMTFLDMGDQFLALIRGRHRAPDRNRHFGLVIDGVSYASKLAEESLGHLD